MNETAVDFWNRVKTLIKSNNLTQESLAQTAGLNFSNLKQQIFYKRFPTVDIAFRIAETLNTTVEYLVSGKDSKPKADTSRILSTLQIAIEQIKEL